MLQANACSCDEFSVGSRIRIVLRHDLQPHLIGDYFLQIDISDAWNVWRSRDDMCSGRTQARHADADCCDWGGLLKLADQFYQCGDEAIQIIDDRRHSARFENAIVAAQ